MAWTSYQFLKLGEMVCLMMTIVVRVLEVLVVQVTARQKRFHRSNRLQHRAPFPVEVLVEWKES
jgi:hypothetical protein